MSSDDKELVISAEQVRREHLAEVRAPIQWLYLMSLLIGGFVAMLAFIAARPAIGSRRALPG